MLVACAIIDGDGSTVLTSSMVALLTHQSQLRITGIINFFLLKLIDNLTIQALIISYVIFADNSGFTFFLMCTKWLTFCYLSLHARFLGCLGLVLCSYHPTYFGWISPFIDASCFLEVISTLYVKHNGWKISALHVSALHCCNNYFIDLLCMVY